MIQSTKVLIDTDIIINILREDKKTIETIDTNLDDCIFYISTVVWMEIYKGIREGEEEKILQLLNFYESFVLCKEVGIIAGKFLNQYSKSHGLEEIDALVAATAKVYNCKLFTNNKKHFRMIDDIQLFD